VGVSKNGGTPMDGENNGKPYVLMGDLGGCFPPFLETPRCFLQNVAMSPQTTTLSVLWQP